MFGRRNAPQPAEDDEEQEPEFDLVTFRGPLSGDPVDMSAHASVARVGLGPAREMISDALSRRGEMVRLDTRGPAAAVRTYIDGVAYPGGRMPARQAAAITQVLKLLAGLDVKVRDQPQSGGIKADLDGVKYVLRIDTEPAGQTERLTVRAENQNEKLEKPEELGFPPDLKELIREMAGGAKGGLFIVGPPLSGVTTTTFGVLRSVDSYVYNIYAIGDLGGRDLHTLTDFTPNKGESLDDAIVRVIRAEADVIYLNRIKTQEEAQRAVKFGEDLSIIAELAAKDLVSGIGQLCKWSGDPSLIADRVNGLIQPRLIRKLCGKCKQAFRPNPKLVAKVNLPPETDVLYRPPGREVMEAEDYEPCRRCGGVGYLGRTGIFAVLRMTDGVKEILRTKPSGSALKQQIRADGMPSFESEGLRLVAEGVTSLEELQRVFQEAA
ncbi:ATPase, T2SS/T4P/T4SS family [Alienimonas californiensis]|uniref:Type II secretion system protein E n=1 Tax=Alienimonas californiensis TaxID=2527989 RepID=A0A517PFF7_9PLAN|nr:ATPase, T2SS/T4P/T4SS family [Alienimonas californiensis]QDT18099.1 Type II secretion system protein E [Alienimonas californiensis]